MQTGILVADIVFSPAILELDDMDQIISDFYVAATEDMVAVYFGSSRQLFAFDQLSEELITAVL